MNLAGWASLMARFEVPDGWCVQAFRFTLDPIEDQARHPAAEQPRDGVQVA
jgi:hypothetical protein